MAEVLIELFPVCLTPRDRDARAESPSAPHHAHNDPSEAMLLEIVD